MAFQVALLSVAANSKVMSRMRAVQSAMHSSQVPKVTSRRYSLPTCVMRARIKPVNFSVYGVRGRG